MNIRRIELMRVAWGAALVIAPAVVLARVHGLRVDRKALVVARILGARHLLQTLLSGLNPSPEKLAAGVWVDSVHALTAFGLAAVDHDRARAGIVDGVVALSWAGLCARDLSAGNAPRAGTVGGLDRLARTVIGALPGGRGLMERAQQVRTDQAGGRSFGEPAAG